MIGTSTVIYHMHFYVNLTCFNGYFFNTLFCANSSKDQQKTNARQGGTLGKGPYLLLRAFDAQTEPNQKSYSKNTYFQALK